MKPLIPQWLLEQWLAEDLQLGDITTSLLGLEGLGRARLLLREAEAVAACCREAARIYSIAGARPVRFAADGQVLRRGSALLEVQGDVRSLHAAWRVAQELASICVGIATKSRRLVERAKRINPNVEIVSTRKTYPGLRALMVKAATSGGIFPHRTGLSDSILIFKNHVKLLGGPEKAAHILNGLKRSLSARRIMIEAESLDEAYIYARGGADVVQLDHMSPDDIRSAVPELRRISQSLLVAAAGGIDEDNIADYVSTGVDMIVTSAPYRAKPADLTTVMEPL